jgi:hypothetical protein
LGAEWSRYNQLTLWGPELSIPDARFMPSTRILQWQVEQIFHCKGVVPITTIIEGSKMCLEYHIFDHPGPTFILVGVPPPLIA